MAPFTAKDGKSFTIRPIRPEDEPLLVRFHEMLTAETVYARYLGFLGLSTRTAHERLTRVTFNDYDREIALVAEDTDENGQPVIVAVGRLSRSARGTGRGIRDPRRRRVAGPRLWERSSCAAWSRSAAMRSSS